MQNFKLQQSIELDCDIQVVAYFLRELEEQGVLPAYHFKTYLGEEWNPTKKVKRFVWINVWTDFISPHYHGDFYIFADNDWELESIPLSELVTRENSGTLSFRWERLKLPPLNTFIP